MTDLLNILARNAIATAILAAAVLAITLVVKRPAVRNALWLLVLVRLLIPPVWSVPLPARQTAETPLAVARTEPITETSSQMEVAPLSPVTRDFDTTAWTADRVAPLSAEGLTIEPVPIASPAHAAMGSIPTALPNWFAPGLLAVWLAGSVAIVVLAWYRIRRFQRGLVDAHLAPAEVQRRATAIAAQLGLKHCPPVWLVPGRLPPMLWMPGLIARKGRLIFPVDLFFRLSADQRGALIAHELAHLRRCDPWVRWLELLAVALYWWYPLLGLIRRRLRASEEECCDAWVVSKFAERKAYATALMETVEFLDGPGCRAAPQLASGASPVHDLQRRLTMIMRGPMRGRLTRFGALAILGVAVGALAFGPAFSLAQPDEPKERKERPGKDGPERKGGFDRKKGEPDVPGDLIREEIQKARAELEQARQHAEKAMQRVRELEERMHKLAGGRRGGADGDNPKGPSKEEPRRRGPGGDGQKGPPRGELGAPGGLPGAGGQERQLQEMQKQIEDLRRVLDEMRKEMQRGNDRPTPKGATPERKDRPMNPFGRGLPGGGGFPGRPGVEKGPEKLPAPPVKDD